MTELIHYYGAWVVFILVFLEAVGLPFPGETVLVTAAIYAGTTQNLSIGLVLLAAVVGATLGSAIGFWVGERYGYPLLLRYGGYAGLTEARIKIVQYLFQRYGMGVVLVARFVAVLRSLAAIIAGASQMPFVRFMIATTAGAIAWALVYGLAAYYLGKEIEHYARPVAFTLAIVGAIAIVAGLIYWRRKEQELAAAAERAIPGPLRIDNQP
jgi:membrane protein DedA with SNARE-associated domain